MSGPAPAAAGRELRAPIERVGALAGLGLDGLRDDGEALGLNEPFDGGALGLDPEPTALLLPCGDTIVGNGAIHTKGIPPFALCMKSIGRPQQRDQRTSASLHKADIKRRRADVRLSNRPLVI